ncbi:MAG TPA: uroporphyrinogen-III C-methyltransferase [Solirubrobacteraceae bacterium]|nr:uroporphyrinogen-III C-methyltransferase [Solirubrobacteraceae bacterium]
MSAGRVFFVGAGPGDPGLLTARALELIADADVILHDRLIPAQALAGARADAEVIDIGKQGGGPSAAQSQIERALVEHARAGRRVVRLKGGDPFVFGRGGEEALAVRAAGIDYEVVPGVTAGVAAAAYAGIPVTQRGLASAVALVTAHEDPGKAESAIDWEALARFPGTLVFYMGVRQLEALAAALLAAGRPASEPAAIVERGTLPGQRTVAATLGTLAQRAAEERVAAPAVTIVGPVAGLAEELAWLARGPLGGRTVVVTRARAQAGELRRRLEALGARVVEAPAIRIAPREGLELPPLEGFDLLCLTSANGAELLLAALGERGLDARALAGVRVAAIGPGTAAALRERGVIADVVAERFLAEGLLEALAGVRATRALLARAAGARDTLVEGLRERGVEVVALELYDTLAETLEPAAIAALEDADYVTFTSASTVRNLLAQARPGARARLASIGPITSAALREHELEPHVQATEHDLDGLVRALLTDRASCA